MKRFRLLKSYPILILFMLGTLGLGLIILLLTRLNVSVQVEPVPPDQLSSPTPAPSIARSPEPASPSTSPSVAVEPSPSRTTPASTPTQAHPGELRVSNQSEHPVRVVLLAQLPSTNASPGSTKSPSDRAAYAEPVHWDFAPEEGSVQGLILSLPNGKLQIREGDILIAFAQDGSRRYWGPYVVGNSNLPKWTTSNAEWQLVLQN